MVEPHTEIELEISAVEVDFVAVPIDQHEVATDQVSGSRIQDFAEHIHVAIEHIQLSKGSGDGDAEQHIRQLTLLVETVGRSESVRRYTPE